MPRRYICAFIVRLLARISLLLFGSLSRNGENSSFKTRRYWHWLTTWKTLAREVYRVGWVGNVWLPITYIFFKKNPHCPQRCKRTLYPRETRGAIWCFPNSIRVWTKLHSFYFASLDICAETSILYPKISQFLTMPDLPSIPLDLVATSSTLQSLGWFRCFCCLVSKHIAKRSRLEREGQKIQPASAPFWSSTRNFERLE